LTGGAITLTAGTFSAGSSTIINSTGTFTFNGGSASLGALSLAGTGKVVLSSGGGKVLLASSVSMATGTRIDLADNAMIVNYSGASPAATIRGYIVQGYNHGNWNGATGIVSATAAGNSSRTTALGYAETTDVGVTTFQGQPIAQAVLVKYTYYGDSSLDGKVDLGNDFNLFLQGYLKGGSTWELGDYNYDGVVNLTDFRLFIDGYNAQGSALGALDSVIESSALLSTTQKGQLLTVVPEPGVELPLWTVLSVFAMSSRRRRSLL
jgi:hypothetical protein